MVLPAELDSSHVKPELRLRKNSQEPIATGESIRFTWVKG